MEYEVLIVIAPSHTPLSDSSKIPCELLPFTNLSYEVKYMCIPANLNLQTPKDLKRTAYTKQVRKQLVFYKVFPFFCCLLFYLRREMKLTLRIIYCSFLTV